jgi:nucleoside-diphosphate-sugar epimerase
MLLERGLRVRVLDNLMYGQQSLLHCFRHPGFEFVRGDIRDGATVHSALDGVDGVVHLAAIVGAPACRRDPELARAVNQEATSSLLELAARDVPLVFASTTSNYGAQDQPCDEDTALNPLSEYGLTKTAAETAVRERGNAAVLRFASAFGMSPRLRLDLMVNDFTWQAVKNGALIVYEKGFRRTFAHVGDLARSILLALQSFGRMRDQVFNVGHSSLSFSKEEVALIIRQRVEFFLYFAAIGSDPDRRDYEVSYDRIAGLGFDTEVSLEQGIDELIRGFEMVTLRNPYSNIEE